MNPESGDERLRQLFHELREQDGPRTPPFPRPARAAWEASRTTPWYATPWAGLASVAAALVVLLGISFVALRFSREPATMNYQQWVALTEWEASTDSLLTWSTTPWDSSVDTVTDTWLDRAPSAPDATTQSQEETP